MATRDSNAAPAIEPVPAPAETTGDQRPKEPPAKKRAESAAFAAAWGRVRVRHAASFAKLAK
jgi:hypothetical protein